MTILITSCLVLFPIYCTNSFAQSVPPSNPVINNPTSSPIYFGNGGIGGYSGGGQCGTTLSASVGSTIGSAPVPLSDKVVIGNSQNVVAQLQLTHSFNNPCLNQKDQLRSQERTTCRQLMSQFVIQNPTMPIPEVRERVGVFCERGLFEERKK
jgi:hypothetical protein